MVKVMKSQKVVIVLAGRYAGRKAVVIKVIHTFHFPMDFLLYYSSHMMMVRMNEVTVMPLLLVFLVTHVT